MFPGIRVAIPDRAGLQASAGTARARWTRASSYEKGAVVARGAWRPLSDAEWRNMTRPTETPSVALFALPGPVLEPFREIREIAARARTARQLWKALPDHDKQVRAFLRYAVRRYGCGSQARDPGGIHVNDPGMRATTVNPKGGKRVGLHLDDWYRAAPRNRHKSPNRICVNLGSEDRYFLFLNLPIRRVYELAGASSDLSGSAAGQLFFRRFPSYPVIKLRMRPGEAYIAPTENLIHDGCSAGMTTPDATLSLLGRFRAG